MTITLPANAGSMTLSDFEASLGRSVTDQDILVVPHGTELVLDISAQLGGIVVQGSLGAADNGPLDLSSDWILVIGGGRFELGTEDAPYQNDFNLTLTGDDPHQDINVSEILMEAGQPMMPGMAPMVVQNQDNMVMVMGEGSTMSLHGVDAAKTAWTQLDGTVQAGDTTLTLAEAAGWQAGDVIAIASTDFDLNQAEEHVITGVSADGLTITLQDPLAFMHYGEIEEYSTGSDTRHLDMRAEVGLLSRNITISGSEEAADTLYGGHTMVMNGGEMYISGVEFTRMGQAGILGKYAAHWHLSGDVSGQYIKDSSFHHTYNKGITIHGTQNAALTDNVVYETIGHSYFFENGQETGNVLTGNLGINARSAEVLKAHDDLSGLPKHDKDAPSVFWVETGGNEFYGNHAAGSEHSGFFFQNGAGRDIREPGILIDNASHSNAELGFFMNHGGRIQDRTPTGSAEQPQKVDAYEIEGMTIYKTKLGAYIRGVEGTFVDSAFGELAHNARFRLNQTIKDSLIVGRTDNIGTPETEAELAEGRSLPPGGVFRGFQLYDGPGGMDNVHLDGFEGPDTAIYLSNAIHKSVSHFVKGLTWGEAVDEASKLDFSGGIGGAVRVDNQARAIVDVDGSLTGTPGAIVNVKMRPGSDGEQMLFNAGETHYNVDHWGAVVTTGATMGMLRIDKLGTDALNNGKVSGWGAENKVMIRSDGEVVSGFRTQVPVFSDDSYTYRLEFDGGPAQFRLYLGDVGRGENVIVTLGTVPGDARFVIDDPYSRAARDAREVSSMEHLEASPDTAVFRDADGVVHINLVAEMSHGYLFPQPGATFNNVLNSGVTVLVDMEAQVDLAAIVYDDPVLASDGEVHGTEGDDVINAGFVDARDGDRTDRGDNAAGNDDDVIFAFGGDDRILAGSGHDDVHAGDGADSVSGGHGNDLIYGGAGRDNLRGEAGGDQLFGEDGRDRLAGGSGDDFLFGGADNDHLLGGVGADLLDGGADNDVLRGHSGTDQLFGGAGNDRLLGGRDADILIGGAGADQLFGQGGADVFVFAALSDSTASAQDHIRDFTSGLDLLDFSALESIAGFDDLSITRTGPHTRVDAVGIGEDPFSVLLRNFTDTLTENDFVFG